MDYEKLMDLIASEESASQISDAIKDILYSKSIENIESITPDVSASMFNTLEDEDE